MGSGVLVLVWSHPSVQHSCFRIFFVPANPSVRSWGPHDFLAVLFRAKKCVEVNGVQKASKTPWESAFDLFCVPKLSAARLRVKTAEFEPEKLHRLFTAHYGLWGFPQWFYGWRSSSRFKSYEVSKFRLVLGWKIKIKRGATRGLPGRSPILLLLSSKHA